MAKSEKNAQNEIISTKYYSVFVLYSVLQMESMGKSLSFDVFKLLS